MKGLDGDLVGAKETGEASLARLATPDLDEHARGDDVADACGVGELEQRADPRISLLEGDQGSRIQH